MGFMERVARIKAAVVPRSRPLRQLQSRTIARRASQIGWQVGPWPRRLGAVRTRARAARRQLVVAPEPSLVKWLTHDFGAGLGTISGAVGMLRRKQALFRFCGRRGFSIGACAIFRCW